jgi:hypothetical protein
MAAWPESGRIAGHRHSIAARRGVVCYGLIDFGEFIMGLRHLGVRAGLVTGAAALAVIGLTGTAAASVSPTPATGTPQLYPNGTTEQVRKLVQCGGTMYAVGSFTRIQQGSSGTVYTRNNVFSFSATSPFTVTSWAPNVNGTVNTIAFNGTDCSTAYIGGQFSSVNGSSATNIAAISTSTGALVAGFAHSANGQVETIASHSGHLLTGGYFTSVNGSSHKYMASLSPSTGNDDGFVNLNISGNYHYCNSAGTRCAGGNATRVYNQQLSHSGTLDLVEGDFTSVGGQPRQQIFMLNLSGTTATVTGWYPTEFNEHCWFSEPFYTRAASWSPDDSTVYTATTGFHLFDWNGSYPLTGICDTAGAFPATQTVVSHRWLNYTGCDSLYSTAADSTTAYFAGHERWSQNANGCNFQGSGGISAPGMEGLSPSNGLLTFNPTRARGLGADDMMVTSAGLWIASDNLNNASQCGGVFGHAGICFMPF